jgi:D-xylose transport system substrate-binding protein
LQIRQADEMIAQGAKVLVINPVNFNTAAEIIRKAHKNNVKVIAYDRIIRNCNLDFYLSFNNEKVGNMMANYVVSLKPEGKYMILSGDKSDQNAIWVKNGVVKVLDPFIKNGKIKVVYDVFVEAWSAENANHEVKQYINLTSGELPDVIISSSDGISAGVVDALVEYDVAGTVLVTGQNADLKACQNIVNGAQIMTVYKPFKKLAYKAAELAIKMANGEIISENTTTTFNGVKDVTTLLFEPILIDKSNLRATVIADGFLTESDVFKK